MRLGWTMFWVRVGLLMAETRSLRERRIGRYYHP